MVAPLSPTNVYSTAAPIPIKPTTALIAAIAVGAAAPALELELLAPAALEPVAAEAAAVIIEPPETTETAEVAALEPYVGVVLSCASAEEASAPAVARSDEAAAALLLRSALMLDTRAAVLINDGSGLEKERD